MARIPYCTTMLQGDTCTVVGCSNNHKLSQCELCHCGFPPSTLKQHQTGRMHLQSLASSGTSNPGTQSTPSPPSSSNLQTATSINTSPPDASGDDSFTPDAGPRVTVSGEDGLDFVVEGLGTAENSSFLPSSQTIVIEKTKILSSLSVSSVAVSPLRNSCFTASLDGELTEVQQNKPRKVFVSFRPSSVGTFHAVLRITFRDRTKPYEQDFTVKRELRGRAILPASHVSNGEASTAAGTAEDTVGADDTGITVSHDYGLEFSAAWPPSGETQTEELIITKSSTTPSVSIKDVRILSTDDSVNGSFSALYGGDFAMIQPRQRHIVPISFHPGREGLCEAALELTFHHHKRKVDFVVNRTLSGWARRQPSGQERHENGSAAAPQPQQIDNWGVDDTSVYSDEEEELWDSEGTGISVSSEDGLDFGMVERKRPNGPFATATISLTIKLEDGFSAITFLNERIKTGDGSDSDFVATFEGDTRIIQPGTESTVRIIFSPKFDGLFRAQLVLFFYDPEQLFKFVVRRSLQGIAGSVEDHKLFEPLDHQEDDKKYTKETGYQPPETLMLLPTRGRQKKSRRLPEYEVPSIVKEAIEDSTARRPYDKKAQGIVATLRPHKLTMDTYVDWFTALLQVEDGHQQSDILCQPYYVVEVEDRGKRQNIEIENTDEDLLPEVIVGDYLWLDDIQEDIRYEARIASAEVFSRGQGRQAVLKISLRLPTEFNLYMGAQFILRFRLNRITLRRQFHALATLSTTPHRLLFPSAADLKPMRRLSRNDVASLDLVNERIRDDNQQLQTVVSILQQPKGTVPFIIFGPPGTGKTTTVVESMIQLIRRDANVKILACTPSNAAADLLVERLAAAGLDFEQLYRLNAFSREEHIPDDVQQFSVIPKREELLAFRVVLSTCSSAGMLKVFNVPVGHFSHIVVDEAAQAEEPLAMIPILAFSDANTNIILAGDPHQLRPVIKSPTASKYGLRKSYLERLMDMREVYGLDTQVGRTIVDLQQNRRSHAAIIAWPNRYLYEDRMRAHGDADITDRMLQWDELPNKDFPIIFHGIKGTEKRTRRSPSYYNILEASIVRDYCVKLTTSPGRKIRPDDIGIIAPYRAQVRTIRELLRTVRLAEISVGSVEQFQGQERKVIIMATTRSNEEYHPRRALGFVMNPRRMNVAITRAQSLLIMIGDPEALGKDDFWRTFINYIRPRKGSKGKEPSWRANDGVQVPVREIVPRSGGVVYGKEFIDGKSEEVYRFHLGDE